MTDSQELPRGIHGFRIETWGFPQNIQTVGKAVTNFAIRLAVLRIVGAISLTVCAAEINPHESPDAHNSNAYNGRMPENPIGDSEMEHAGAQRTGSSAKAEARNSSPTVIDILQRAVKLHSAGERCEAERLYRQVLQVEARHPDVLHRLGLIELEKRNPQVAIDLIQQAIQIDPGQADYYMDLGNGFRALGNSRRAAESYIQSIRLNPQSAEAYTNLGNVFKDGQQFDDAIACYRQAIAVKPGLCGAHENLGNALRLMCRFEDAQISYRKALELDPDRPSAHYNLAQLMSDVGNLDEAMDHCNRCLELGIDSPDRALFLQGLIELVRGDLGPGWDHYERRWGNPDHDTPNRDYAQPLWAGERLHHGKLLIWGEQGIGDEIMFAGLLPEVLRTGNRCIIECDSRLTPLFGRSFPGITVVSRPAEEHTLDFAAHIPSGSLPRLLRSSHKAFQATTSPYLIADAALRQTLRARYDDGRPLIGLAWKTKSKKSGHLRSIDLAAFAPLFSDGNLRVVNLQYGNPDELAAEVQAAEMSLVIDREVDQFSNMDSFAAQIDAMDLVIAIDNSTAHLAGALGIPVWLLLPLVPDWRWQLNREDSPWYPSMQIFRQQRVSEWTPVLERVSNALLQFAACAAGKTVD